MFKFALKVVILAAVFYGLTYFEVLPGLDVDPNLDGPLGEYGTTSAPEDSDSEYASDDSSDTACVVRTAAVPPPTAAAGTAAGCASASSARESGGSRCSACASSAPRARARGPGE